MEMAWEDRKPIEALKAQFGIKENEVRLTLQRELKEYSLKIFIN